MKLLNHIYFGYEWLERVDMKLAIHPIRSQRPQNCTTFFHSSSKMPFSSQSFPNSNLAWSQMCVGKLCFSSHFYLRSPWCSVQSGSARTNKLLFQKTAHWLLSLFFVKWGGVFYFFFFKKKRTAIQEWRNGVHCDVDSDRGANLQKYCVKLQYSWRGALCVTI